MGIVWEAYHKGVPLLGVPGITLDQIKTSEFLHMKNHVDIKPYSSLNDLS